MNIIVLDDEEYVVDGISNLLSSRLDGTLRVNSAYTVAEARRLMRRITFDVFVSDVCMRETDGISLVGEFRRNNPRCWIVFITAFDLFDNIYRATKHDRVKFLLKLEGDEKILETVEEVLERIRLERREEQESDGLPRETIALGQKCLSQLVQDALRSGRECEEARLLRTMSEWQLPVDGNRPFHLILMLVRGRSVGPEGYDGLVSRADVLVRKAVAGEPNAGCLDCSAGDAVHIWLIQSASWSRVKADQVVGSITSMNNTTTVRGVDGSVHIAAARTDRQFRLGETGRVVVQLKYVALYSVVRATARGLRDNVSFTELREQWTCALASHPEYAELCADVSLLDRTLAGGFADDGVTGRITRIINEIDGDRVLATLEARFLLILSLLTHLRVAGTSQRIHETVERTVSEMNKLGNSQFSEVVGKIMAVVRGSGSSHNERTVRRVQKHIEEHMQDGVSIKTIASSLGFHPGYLARLYKATTGEGLKQYIDAYRLERARVLLTDNEDMTVGEIAASLGFETPQSFIRFFKRYQKTTPLRYRHDTMDDKSA